MQQPAVSINQKPQIFTHISNELGVTTVRLSCVDDFFFPGSCHVRFHG